MQIKRHGLITLHFQVPKSVFFRRLSQWQRQEAHGNSCLMSHLCSLPFQGYSSCCQIQNHTPAVWQFSSGQKNYETASVLLLNNNREFSRYKDIKLNSLGLGLPTGILTAGSFDQEQWQLGTCHKCFQFFTPSARAWPGLGIQKQDLPCYVSTSRPEEP